MAERQHFEAYGMGGGERGRGRGRGGEGGGGEGWEGLAAHPPAVSTRRVA